MDEDTAPGDGNVSGDAPEEGAGEGADAGADDPVAAVYAEIEDPEPGIEEFRAAVNEKVQDMGGLADEETAAMLLAHDLEGEDGGDVEGIADIEAEMEEVTFLGKVTSVGDVRTFEREEEDREEGRVLNADVADETGSVRITFWDRMAVEAEENLEAGDVIRVGGRPKDGYNGVEVNVGDIESDPDAAVDVQIAGRHDIDSLSLGLSDVNVRGRVLETDAVRTFDRDDGSEGKVSNLLLGDETGRIRVTMWDARAERAEELEPGDAVEVVDGYTRERDGSLELHVGDRGRVEDAEGEVAFTAEADPIDGLELGETADIAGVVRSADPKRTFDRDDGSEGQVRNVRVQDDTGDIRVALWGEKADAEVGPGDEVLVTDAEIQDGWQDDLEASAGWGATLVVLAEGEATEVGTAEPDTEERDDAATGLSDFADGEGPGDSGNRPGGEAAAVAGESTGDGDAEGAGEDTEFTGVVVQAGSPVILDDGERTVSVETDADVELGQEITVRGRLEGGRLDAEEVR
jgi:replication factor A1